MKTILGVVAAVAIGALTLWIVGWRVHTEKNQLWITGPAQVDPLDAEAEANTPECQGLKERFPEKAYYTMRELDERSNAAMLCINAKIEYIKNKHKRGIN